MTTDWPMGHMTTGWPMGHMATGWPMGQIGQWPQCSQLNEFHQNRENIRLSIVILRASVFIFISCTRSEDCFN